jgi:hypothetical protein
MKKIFTIFLILFFAAKAFCQLTYTQDIRHIAQIQFPAKPDTVKELSVEMVMYQYSGEHEIYYAQIFPLEKTLKDLFTTDINNKFYSQYITGVLKSTKGKLIYKRSALVDSLKGVEYLFRFDRFGEKCYSYNRLVFFNNTLINFSISSLDSLKSDNKKLNAYFNSFKVTIPNNDIVSNNGREIASGLAKYTAYIIMIAIPVLIGFSIVFAIKKMAYRKSRL